MLIFASFKVISVVGIGNNNPISGRVIVGIDKRRPLYRSRTIFGS
jgi:hypothetical protein